MTSSITWQESAAMGIAHGTFCSSFVVPLEAVKVRMQNDASKRLSNVVGLLYREGWRSYYCAWPAYMWSVLFKQTWTFPVMTHFSPRLNKLGDTGQQVATGFTIASIQSAVLTPLDNMRREAHLLGRSHLSFSYFLDKGWDGVGSNWTRLVCWWVPFLVTQNYLRNACRSDGGQPLSSWQLGKIGFVVSAVVTAVSAPSDYFFSTRKMGFARDWFRGAPVAFTSLLFQNVVSLGALELLETKKGSF